MNFKLVYRKENRDLKILIWIYIVLLIFEGALRKWVLPSLSDVLLVIRDPIAIWVIFKALNRNLIDQKLITLAIATIGVLSLLFALLFAHGSIPVALYGVRPFVIHLPFAFALGKIFDKNDVIRTGKFFIYLLPFMTLITIIQFYSLQSAWINIGVGWDTSGAGFGGALGYYRPPGTFSFINGLSLYYGITSAFLFYFIEDGKYIKKQLIYIGLICTVLSIPFSISRTILFQNFLCLLFFIPIGLKKKIILRPLFLSIIAFSLVMSIFWNNEIVMTPIEVFSSRFESANESEGGLEGTIY